MLVRGQLVINVNLKVTEEILQAMTLLDSLLPVEFQKKTIIEEKVKKAYKEFTKAQPVPWTFAEKGISRHAISAEQENKKKELILKESKPKEPTKEQLEDYRKQGRKNMLKLIKEARKPKPNSDEMKNMLPIEDAILNSAITKSMIKHKEKPNTKTFDNKKYGKNQYGVFLRKAKKK